jgi:hypothetical protein
MATTQIHSQKDADGVAPLWAADVFSPARGAMTAWRAALSLPLVSLMEALRFGSRRLQAHADYLSGVMERQDAEQAIQRQSAFIHDAMKDYGREAEMLVHNVREMTQDQAKAA